MAIYNNLIQPGSETDHAILTPYLSDLLFSLQCQLEICVGFRGWLALCVCVGHSLGVACMRTIPKGNPIHMRLMATVASAQPSFISTAMETRRRWRRRRRRLRLRMDARWVFVSSIDGLPSPSQNTILKCFLQRGPARQINASIHKSIYGSGFGVRLFVCVCVFVLLVCHALYSVGKTFQHYYIQIWISETGACARVHRHICIHNEYETHGTHIHTNSILTCLQIVYRCSLWLECGLFVAWCVQNGVYGAAACARMVRNKGFTYRSREWYVANTRACLQLVYGLILFSGQTCESIVCKGFRHTIVDFRTFVLLELVRRLRCIPNRQRKSLPDSVWSVIDWLQCLILFHWM